MAGRYEELERLQRLRESGALTDEEFASEKRRILGHDAVAPDEEAAAEGREEPASRRPLYLAVGGVALIAALAAGLWLGKVVGDGGTGQNGNVRVPEENIAVEENLIGTVAPLDIRTLPPEEQLARAFETAFGARGAATVRIDAGKDYNTESFPEEVRYTAGRLLWPAFGPVLLSEGAIENAAHVSAGKIAIHYLKPAGDGFEVVRAFPTGVVTGSSGHVARWSVSARFSNWPVIVAESGGTWQGLSCSWLTLTELRPDGPAELVTFPLSYDDRGAKEEEEADATSIAGRIINVVRNRSFDVVYSGSRAFNEHYVRSGKGYAVAGGESTMERC